MEVSETHLEPGAIHDLEEHEKHRYLTCEKKGVFILLMIAGGMMGAYTYNLRGNVFCNAQTANVVLMAMALGKAQWKEAVYYLIPISAYFAGAFVSDFLPNPVKRMRLLRWDTFLVGVEIIVLFIIGWMPLTVDNRIVQVMINFICSMQYNTFRQAEGIPMATTFCTNHVRQIGISLSIFIKHHDKYSLKRGLTHILMLLVFLGGGILLTVCCTFFLEKAIWFALIPLVIDFIILAHADISSERDRLTEKPQGHGN